MAQVLPKGKYEACWFIEYSNDRPTKKGIYNFASDRPEEMAYSQPKDHIAKAGILARCGNRVERIILNCEGYDFCNFEWVAGKSALTGKSGLNGLTLVTRNERATFYFDGSVDVKNRDNSEDKLFHYGRG